MVTINKDAYLIVYDGEHFYPARAWHNFRAELLHFSTDEHDTETIISSADAAGHVGYLEVVGFEEKLP